jgi:hypothetical protein
MGWPPVGPVEHPDAKLATKPRMMVVALGVESGRERICESFAKDEGVAYRRGIPFLHRWSIA